MYRNYPLVAPRSCDKIVEGLDLSAMSGAYRGSGSAK